MEEKTIKEEFKVSGEEVIKKALLAQHCYRYLPLSAPLRHLSQNAQSSLKKEKNNIYEKNQKVAFIYY